MSDNRKMGHSRGHIQFGGASPNNPLYYYDVDTNAFTITGVSNPVSGGVERIVQSDPYRLSGYSTAGKTVSPADLPSYTLTFREKKRYIPRVLMQGECPLATYEPSGECQSLADIDRGWSDYVMVYSGGLATDRNPGDRTSFDADDSTSIELGVTCDAIYPVGALGFSNRNTTAITLEINDVIYGNNVQCGNCGTSDDGAQRIYAVEKGGASAKPIVHYSLDGGNTWATSSISTAANAEAIAKLGIMGRYLVALSPTANTSTRGGYYYAELNALTGAPGAWVKVTTGFTDNFEPRDMVVLGPREAYICTDAGEILKLENVTSGATSLGVFTSSDLTRITASKDGDVIVAVGASATVLRSINRGANFSAVTTAPGSSTLNAVAVLGPTRIMVGDSSGVVYYTETAGESAWSTLSLGVTPAAIQDIKFATPEVGYIAYTITGTLARIAATITGGRSWSTSDTVAPRMSGVPTTALQRYNRIAIPDRDVAGYGVAANNVIAAGLGASTDGCLVQGKPSVI